VFVRGLYKNHGENVVIDDARGVAADGARPAAHRLGLAKWLVSGQHPLTARACGQSIWQQCFGLGLVRTAEDFGVRGELPTHPELLDYLATELVDSSGI